MLENLLEGDEIRTDVDRVIKTIERLGPENVVCFMSTTSCFAPRAPDRFVTKWKIHFSFVIYSLLI